MFAPAQSYVILSRVTSPDQLFLSPFNQEKIYCHTEAKAEALRLQKKAINLQMTDWERGGENIFRIFSLNVRSLPQHRQDLETDKFIMMSDIILMQETWLNKDLQPPITKFSHQYFDHLGSKGTGMVARDKPEKVEKLQTSECSVIKAEFPKFDLINIYHYSNTSIISFTASLEKVLNTSKTSLVFGDMNIDLLKTPEDQFTTFLRRKGFKQLVSHSTHLQVGYLIY